MGTPNSSPSKRNQISKKEKAGEETKKTYTERKSSRSKRLLRHETLSNVDKKQYRREMKKKKKKICENSERPCSPIFHLQIEQSAVEKNGKIEELFFYGVKDQRKIFCSYFDVQRALCSVHTHECTESLLYC